MEANPAISLHDIYYQLATHTTASHAGRKTFICFALSNGIPPGEAFKKK